MSQLALFIDAPTLSEATAVYTDAALTVLAVDGYYSDQNITRQQLSGALGASITCPDCSGSTPAAPTVYNVIQNVTNNIVGGTLNVDYTLSGTGYDGNDPAGPVTQTGQVNEQYKFQISPSLVQGKQFSSASPFSATNPEGSIPVGGTTVTNTLSGTIEIIPSDAGTLNYVLTACQGNNGESPSSGLISRTLANKPIPNQQFAAMNIEPIQYYYYNPSITAKSNPPQSDFLEQPAGEGFDLTEIVGETGCPEFNVITGDIVQLKKCLDGSTDYYMQIPYNTQWRDSTRVTPDGGSTFYTQEGILLASQLSGKTEFTTIQYPDATGIMEGQPGFQSRVVGCPGDTYFELRECNPLVGTTFGGRKGISSLPANNPLFAAGSLQYALNQSGSVYRDNQGSCWQIQDSLSGSQVSAYYSSSSSSIDLEAYVGNDCQACSGYA